MTRPKKKRPFRLSAHTFSLLALLLALIAFGPALAAPFDFDDGPSIVHNRTIDQAWPPTALVHTPPTGTAVSGRPVVNYTFALNRAAARAFGNGSAESTVGYHAVNLLLHVATALLLFLLVRLTFSVGSIPDDWRSAEGWIGVAVAAFWLVHPIQSEAVDYVSQRTEIIVSLCYVATLLAAVRAWAAADGRGRLAWSVTSVAICAAGMASKEVMLTAPIMVVLYDRAFLASSWRALGQRRDRRALYGGLAATMVVAIGFVQRGARDATVGFGLRVKWYEYFYSQGWAIAHYLRLVVWPVGFAFDYGRDPVRGWIALPGLVLLAVGAVLTLVAWTNARWRWAGFLGAWFFLLLAPSSSVIPIQTEIAAERRIYLALAAVLVLVAVGVERLRRAHPRRARSWTFAGVAVWTALLVLCARRSALYTRPVDLWRDTIAHVPVNPRAYDNLAAAELRQDPPDLAAADTLARRATDLDSTFVTAWNRRAAIAIKEDRLAFAETLLTHALAVAPLDSDATTKLSKVALATGKTALAISLLKRIVTTVPSGDAYADLGTAYLASGKLDSATAALELATQLEPANSNALTNLGGALVERGNGRAAIPPLEHALQLRPSPFVTGLLSLAYAEARDTATALQFVQQVRAADPNDPAALTFAARALQTIGYGSAANELLAEAAAKRER